MAGRFIKEAGVSSLKLEGGSPQLCDVVSRITSAGIPLMGHIGILPQKILATGNYRSRGSDEADAQDLMREALALEEAGAFAIVLEGIRSKIAGEITASLSIPTIGIGAGPDCSGQILVAQDLLGLSDFSAQKRPKFVKNYADLRAAVSKAVRAFIEEVRGGEYPDAKHSY